MSKTPWKTRIVAGLFVVSFFSAILALAAVIVFVSLPEATPTKSTERVAPYLEEVEANLREVYLSSGVLGAPLRSDQAREIILDALQKIQVVLLYPRSR